MMRVPRGMKSTATRPKPLPGISRISYGCCSTGGGGGHERVASCERVGEKNDTAAGLRLEDVELEALPVTVVLLPVSVLSGLESRDLSHALPVTVPLLLSLEACGRPMLSLRSRKK